MVIAPLNKTAHPDNPGWAILLYEALSQDARGYKLKRRYTPAERKHTQNKHTHRKGQKETRDTSDIAYPRMRRMHRAFISTLD